MSKTWPPKFTIDQKSVLQLFVGESFYSSVDASIREAVLNSIDAITRRQEVESELIPEIEIVFDRPSMTISIADNGDGMSRDDVESLFAKVGASASAIKHEMNNGNAIGEFGIGVVSYFLMCDNFSLETKSSEEEAIGLKFRRTMLDNETRAEVVQAERKEQGTKLILSIGESKNFDRALEKFPHWIRDVDGLVATKLPENEFIPHGGLSRDIRVVECDMPNWIQKARIGPPSKVSIWDTFDGAASVDVLYKGVFVEKVSIDNFWAINGAIHVDPKKFRPKLNREGFVGQNLENELEPVFRKCHPSVLEVALGCMQDIKSEDLTEPWSYHKWVTLWLAVPRTGEYKDVAQIWDREFFNRPTFRLLEAGGKDKFVSVNQIQEMGVDEVFLAPANLKKSNPLVQQAIRILRNSDKVVFQGITRQVGFLDRVHLVGDSTGDLLIQKLISLVPKIVRVNEVAHSVISKESIASIYNNVPVVKVVNLGANSVSIMPVEQEIWINAENDNGKRIIRKICELNSGHLGVWIAILEHPNSNRFDDFVSQIAKLLASRPSTPEVLGPVKRQFLRILAE